MTNNNEIIIMNIMLLTCTFDPYEQVPVEETAVLLLHDKQAELLEQE